MFAPGVILVVDDEIDLLLIFHTFLTRLGFTVHCASSEEEAEKFWTAFQGQIQLLIVDVNLSTQGSGLDLLDRFLARQPGLHYLITSGYHEEMITWRHPLCEGLNFLPKPIDWKNLDQVTRLRLHK